MLPAEMRALSPAAGDVMAFSDSALEIRATIGAAVACDTVAGGEAIDLAPVRAAARDPLAAYGTTPQPGDIALVFDGGLADRSTSDDAWRRCRSAAVASAHQRVRRITVAGRHRDAARARLRLRSRSARACPPSLRPGAFVHVASPRPLPALPRRHVRLVPGLLGMGRRRVQRCVQPVSGPFAPYSRRAGSSGLAAALPRRHGAAPSRLRPTRARIARVEVVARAESARGCRRSRRLRGLAEPSRSGVRNR